MTWSRTVVLALGLACAQAAHADRAAARMARPALDDGQLRTLLELEEPRVQRCAIETGARASRVQVNLYAFPDGSWSVTTGTPRGVPAAGHRGSDALSQCIARALASQIGPTVRRFAGSRPRKISRRFTVTPAPPAPRTPVDRSPTAAEVGALSRLLAARRRPLAACFPHAAGASSTEVALRLEVAPDGALRVTGLRIPSHLDFRAVAQCVERALDGARGPSTGDTLRGEVPFRTPIDAASASAAHAAPLQTFE